MVGITYRVVTCTSSDGSWTLGLVLTSLYVTRTRAQQSLRTSLTTLQALRDSYRSDLWLHAGATLLVKHRLSLQRVISNLCSLPSQLLSHHFSDADSSKGNRLPSVSEDEAIHDTWRIAIGESMNHHLPYRGELHDFEGALRGRRHKCKGCCEQRVAVWRRETLCLSTLPLNAQLLTIFSRVGHSA